MPTRPSAFLIQLEKRRISWTHVAQLEKRRISWNVPMSPVKKQDPGGAKRLRFRGTEVHSKADIKLLALKFYL